MSLPDTTTILIVGAGPVGLAAALSLRHHGVRDFTIVDAVPQWQNTSRALAVHAATLESLDTISCGDNLASLGNKSTVLTIQTRSTKLISPSLGNLKSYTRHPYTLLIPQNITERVFNEKLESFGTTVNRPLKVVGLKRNASNPQLSDVTFEDGRIITAKYVVGADGARSTIRTMAGIGFSDPAPFDGENENTLAQMAIADVTFDTDTDTFNRSEVTLSQNNYFICFPLPHTFNQTPAAEGKVSASERVFRIGCGVPLREGEVPQTPSKEYLQNLLDQFAPYHLAPDPIVSPNSKSVQIKNIIWSSHFRNRACIADTTFTRLGQRDSESGEGGIILLIGDAAHIHSPIGGQGMNLGIRDAISIGEVLSNHIHASETTPLSKADNILREFSTVQHARALEVIKLTKNFLSVAGMKYRERMYWWCPIDSATFRACVLWLVGSMPFFRRKIAWELSGLGRR